MQRQKSAEAVVGLLPHTELDSVTRFLDDRLNLQVNREKSAVARPWQRKFLGYTVCTRKRNVRLKVAPEIVGRFKGDVKAVLRRGRGWSIRRTNGRGA